MKIRNIAVGVVVSGVIFAGGVAAVAWQKGWSICEAVELVAGVIASKTSRHTIADRTAAILAKKPKLKGIAASAGGKLRILVFKNERTVEVHAPGWKAPRIYPMTAFSGTLGPKLREGDGQIPEGIYGIGYLNPNSSYYLSLKVTYPNASDRARAKADGRTNLGGDIMIHGKAVSIGCVPVGDDAIEDIFYLASAVGIKNVSVVIAPYDMRNGRKPELEESSIAWYPDPSATLKEIAPDSIPVNILDPIAGTPLGTRPPLDFGRILDSIAILRLVNPRTPLRFAGCRRLLTDEQAAEAIAVGIDAGIQGPLLTTPGKDYADDRQLALAAGYEVVQS